MMSNYVNIRYDLEAGSCQLTLTKWGSGIVEMELHDDSKNWVTLLPNEAERLARNILEMVNEDE